MSNSSFESLASLKREEELLAIQKPSKFKNVFESYDDLYTKSSLLFTPPTTSKPSALIVIKQPEESEADDTYIPLPGYTITKGITQVTDVNYLHSSQLEKPETSEAKSKEDPEFFEFGEWFETPSVDSLHFPSVLPTINIDKRMRKKNDNRNRKNKDTNSKDIERDRVKIEIIDNWRKNKRAFERIGCSSFHEIDLPKASSFNYKLCEEQSDTSDENEGQQIITASEIKAKILDMLNFNKYNKNKKQ